MKILHSAKFVGFESLESKTRRGDLETVPFNARRYSSTRETPSNRINRERRRGGREHRLPWLRGEKRKREKGSTRRNKRVENRGRRVMQGPFPPTFFFLLSSPLSSSRSLPSSQPHPKGLFIRGYTSFFPPADYVCARETGPSL